MTWQSPPVEPRPHIIRSGAGPGDGVDALAGKEKKDPREDILDELSQIPDGVGNK
jgi:hypothetical protein